MGQADSYEPIWIRSRDLCLAPDGRRQSRGQRRRDRPGPGPGRRQRHRPVPRAVPHGLHLRRPVRPVGPPGRPDSRAVRRTSPGRRRADGSSSSSGCRCRSATACSTARRCWATARSWGSSPSRASPTTRNSTRAAGSGRPTGPSRRRSNSPAGRVPFGIDLLFECHGVLGTPVVVGVEICEDLWVPIPPSSVQAGAGATILLNLSASNETIGKSQYRTDLVVGQSGRCIAAYAYAGAGPSESTTDLVFGGHCLIAENGRLARGVAPGRRRPADPPRLVLDHPGRRRRQAPVRPPVVDQLRAGAAGSPARSGGSRSSWPTTCRA